MHQSVSLAEVPVWHFVYLLISFLSLNIITNSESNKNVCETKFGSDNDCINENESKNDWRDIEIDNGGWYTPKEDMLAFPGPCNIDKRDAHDLSQEEFLEKFAYRSPVIITGLTKFQNFRVN